MISYNPIKGIFLLILAVSGNFVAETFGCRTQQFLRENMIAKQVIIYSIIYFALSFTNEGHPHPLDLAKQSAFIWFTFLLFTKMSLPFTIVAIVLLACIYVIQSFVLYYEDQCKNTCSEKDKEIIQKLYACEKITTILVFTTILVGFSLYFMKQYKDYSNNWSFLKFIFGVQKCKLL
jgi:hypothetical protein